MISKVNCLNVLGSTRSKGSQQIHCLVRVLLLVSRQLSFHCVLTWWKAGFLFEGTNLIHEGSTLMT
uniref:Uncharacterized protein n=1 Tax=Canis lupus familiaris TaxID=9615 RepID=A0A8C0SCZ9_CANLF